jgi:hypothetical protein
MIDKLIANFQRKIQDLNGESHGNIEILVALGDGDGVFN